MVYGVVCCDLIGFGKGYVIVDYQLVVVVIIQVEVYIDFFGFVQGQELEVILVRGY